MARVIAVCSSDIKGVRKDNIQKGVLKAGYGLVGDAHADSGWHRQVSLLAMESIHKAREMGLECSPGDFAENITSEGIELFTLPVGTFLRVGDQVLLEISQIGKECHTGCAIMKVTGKCIMPKEGVFAKVIEGGPISSGDEITIIPQSSEK
ncbi:MAG TPA: MOSC domain-containing protein [Dehalococcoidales bacterium]|nr:MOSC domain-containing protein [Dehalococcoidales bacterium]